MATDRREVSPRAFLEALAWPTPATAAAPGTASALAGAAALPSAGTATPSAQSALRRRTVALVTSVAVVVVAAGVLVGHALLPGAAAPQAVVAALTAPQQAADVLDPDDLAQVDAQPDSTRLLLRTSAGAHYVARSASGQLCLVRVPDGDVPSEVCVPNRVGADVTIGDDATGQVRLVADGAPAPSTADGWRTAGPNVWVKG